MTISLIGDGIFLIAIAWESYSLWNAPAALSIVGIGMTIPTIAFLLIGGVVSDRRDRRLVMACADGLRAVAVAIVAVLVLMGVLRFWELVVLVAIYGVGTAFFMPAFDAILPELLPKSDLPAANALDQFVRPIAMRLIGPVAGGALVAASTGLAFAIDAASFAACLIAVLVMPRRGGRRVEVQTSSVVALKEGLRFVRQRVWLWGTLLSAAILISFPRPHRSAAPLPRKRTSTHPPAHSGSSWRPAASGGRRRGVHGTSRTSWETVLTRPGHRRWRSRRNRQAAWG
jgi:DHA3 family tetracycline resistance protein-like MFS transporter